MKKHSKLKESGLCTVAVLISLFNSFFFSFFSSFWYQIDFNFKQGGTGTGRTITINACMTCKAKNITQIDGNG